MALTRIRAKFVGDVAQERHPNHLHSIHPEQLEVERDKARERDEVDEGPEAP